MFKINFSIFVFLFIGLFLLAAPESGFSQENISLGCCKTEEVGGVCKGCEEDGQRCSVDGSLCPETSTFILGEVCVQNSSSGSGALCRQVETPVGCCINSKNTCESDVNFDTCTGQYWYEAASCSDVPQCAAPSKDSLSLIQWLLIALVIVIIFSAIREYRKNKSRAK
jgi:hypothetical protein